MNTDVVRIRTDKMMEMLTEKSSRTGGRGRIRTTRMAITPTASAKSPRLARSPKRKPGKENPPDCPAVTSVMRVWRLLPADLILRSASEARLEGWHALRPSRRRLAPAPQDEDPRVRQFLPGAWLPAG